MRALLLVDIQNDFLPGGALAVPRGNEVIAVANRLVPRFELVVATQDYHPAGHGSFATSHPGRAPFDTVQLGGQPQTLWPDHCVQGTAGAELAAELDRGSIQRVFPKGTDPGIDSYSGFFDNDGESSTGLVDYLRAVGVTDLYVLGLATDYCVLFTALDARRLGFRTLVVQDGCRGIDQPPGTVEAAFDRLRDAGVELVLSDEV